MALTRTETTQADWQAGTLSGVVATSGGDLTLTENIGFSQDWNTQPYSDLFQTTVNSVSNGVLNVTSTGNDPEIPMYNLGSFDPNVYRYIKVGYRIVSGSPTQIEIFYLDTANTSASGDYLTVSPALLADGQWHEVYIDMWASANYKTGGNVTGWRYDWATTSGVNMELDYIRLVTGYISPGIRTSPALDLSSVGIAASSRIAWTATTPTNTAVAVDVSLDGGTTWQSATNGGTIPGITPGMNLSGKSLLVRQTLSTTDPTVTPTLSDLTVTVGALQSASATAQGGATDTAHATWIGSVGAAAQASGVMTGRAALVASAAASTIAVATMDWNEHILAVSATVMAGATVDASAIRLLIQTLVVNAIIQPGDIVEIDTAKMTVKINGVNALQFVEGDFFALLPGTNYLEYQDSETQRNVQIITRHRPRWL